LWLEHDRPLRRLQRAAHDVGEGKRDRFDVASFGGRFRRIAEGVNNAIDRMVERAGAAAPKRASANLDEILGPTPDGGKAPAFFGFANQGADDDDGIPSGLPPAASAP